MKNFAAAVLLVLSSSAAFAQQQQATHRYLVATNRPFHGQLAPAMRDGGRGSIGVTLRNVDAFESVNGFAADLTDDEVKALQQSPDVAFIEPARERHALDMHDPNKQVTPYGITMVNAAQVWNVAKPNAVNVVVIDTGLDYRHPELASVFAGGYDFVNKDNDPMDDAGHGTHCAGTIAAANDGSGVVGVAPNVRLWSVKVLDRSGSGKDDDVIKAVDWVLAKKAALGGDWVMSLSLGSTESSLLEKAAFQRAADAGVLAFAASGNESTATVAAPVGFPAAYPSVVAVGAIDAKKTIAVFSNQGPELAVVAPGVDVLSTLPLGTGTLGYVSANGTSMNAPALTGSPRGSITGRFVYCNIGDKGDFPSSVSGNIALIKRGSLTFADKVKNAKAAGAKAVVIFNNDSSALSFTLVSSSDPTTSSFAWPLTVSISDVDGAALLQQQNATITVAYQADDYGTLSGTSMATPHAAGVAALVWSVLPSATAAQVRQALLSTAHDLGAKGVDFTYGNGVLDAAAAADALAPGSTTSGATPAPDAPSTTTGRRTLKR